MIRSVIVTILLFITGCGPTGSSEPTGVDTLTQAEADSIRRVQLRREYVEGEIPTFSVYEPTDAEEERVSVEMQGSLGSLRSTYRLRSGSWGDLVLVDQFADRSGENVLVRWTHGSPELMRSLAVVPVSEFREKFRCVLDCIPGTVVETSDSVTQWRATR